MRVVEGLRMGRRIGLVMVGVNGLPPCQIRRWVDLWVVLSCLLQKENSILHRDCLDHRIGEQRFLQWSLHLLMSERVVELLDHLNLVREIFLVSYFLD